MPRIETTRRMPYTPTEMFDLVADVEQYPRFFPLCEGLRVRTRERVDDREILVAAMDIGYKAIRETITSRVTLDRPKLAVLVELVDGPFRQLENRWQFTEAPAGGTSVKFFMAYELKSLMLQMLVGGLFDQAFRRCVSAFEARARDVYGNGRPPEPDGARQVGAGS
jgi:coenzyme Q-binding protein COQ10